MLKTPNLKLIRGPLLLALALGASVLTYGCQDSAAPAAGSGSATTKSYASVKPAKGGAELWSDNCMRCHNLRPPTEYSNGEWQVIVHHMRVRANLTGEDARQILAFLKSANQQ